VTPVAQSQSSFAAKTCPTTSIAVVSDEPVEDVTRHIADDFDDVHSMPPSKHQRRSYAASAAPPYASCGAAPAPHEQPQRTTRCPDVETVDVPERVVALADDLDIPSSTSMTTSRRRPPMTISTPSSPACSRDERDDGRGASAQRSL
jgi:hypothetical protein